MEKNPATSYRVGSIELIPQAAVAEMLGVTVRTLENWRTRRVGPAWTKIGPRVVYRRTSLEKWVRDQEREPVAALPGHIQRGNVR